MLLSKIVADQVRSRVFIPSTPLLNILQLPFHSQPTSVWAFLAAFCQSRVPPSETASTTTNLNAPPTNSNLNASPIASVAKDAALAARSIAESSASVLRKFFFFFFLRFCGNLFFPFSLFVTFLLLLSVAIFVIFLKLGKEPIALSKQRSTTMLSMSVDNPPAPAAVPTPIDVSDQGEQISFSFRPSRVLTK